MNLNSPLRFVLFCRTVTSRVCDLKALDDTEFKLFFLQIVLLHHDGSDARIDLNESHYEVVPFSGFC